MIRFLFLLGVVTTMSAYPCMAAKTFVSNHLLSTKEIYFSKLSEDSIKIGDVSSGQVVQLQGILPMLKSHLHQIVRHSLSKRLILSGHLNKH